VVAGDLQSVVESIECGFKIPGYLSLVYFNMERGSFGSLEISPPPPPSSSSS
jgi:hypothetical protein